MVYSGPNKNFIIISHDRYFTLVKTICVETIAVYSKVLFYNENIKSI